MPDHGIDGRAQKQKEPHTRKRETHVGQNGSGFAASQPIISTRALSCIIKEGTLCSVKFDFLTGTQLDQVFAVSPCTYYHLLDTGAARSHKWPTREGILGWLF